VLVGLCGASRQVKADNAWQPFTTADGLPTNTVLALAGDWAGTTAGIAHRDTRGWVTVSESGAPIDWVTAIVVDTRGRLWCGTYGQGLFVRDGTTWRVYRQSESGLPGDWITALALDSQGELWIATLGGGLGHFDGQNWASFRPDNSPLPSPWLNCLVVDQRGALWIGTADKGLASYYQGRWQRYRAADSGLLSDEITALAVAADGRLWIGAPEGVCVLTPASSEWQRWPGNWNLPHPYVRALAADHLGRIWVGTPRGIALYQNDTWSNLPLDGVPATISALRVDDSGQLWAGTLGGGVWRYGVAEQAPRAPRPILLVHGWRGPESDRIEDSEFAFLRRWLEQDGFTVFYATGIDPRNTLHENAARLRDNIALAKRATGADQVDIIAFSMGGLNSRAYLESALYAGDVGQIVIMGTPHAGVQLWKTFLLHEIALWTDEPSARELLPEHVALFNETHGNSWQVPYTLVAGDAQADLLPSLFDFLPPSDGLISARSAHALRGPTVRYITTPDLHAWSDETMALGIPSFLWPQTTYRRYLRPALQRPDVLVGEAAPPAWQPLPVETHSPLLSGQIGAKQTITRSLELDAGGTTRLYARWQRGELDVSLIDPRGKRIKPDTADSSAAYFTLPLANFASYILTDTQPGTWTLELSNRNSAGVGYAAYALLDSPLRLEAAADKSWYAAGEPVALRATLWDAARTVAGATVTVTIYAAVGQGQTLTLYDDGQHQDGQIGDGVYGNVWQPVGAGGYYPYFVSAAGVWAGKRYARGNEGVLVISTGAAKLGDALPDKPVDEGDDWVYECMTLPVNVDVARAGEFLLSARLLDVWGQEIASTALPIALKPGQQVVTLRFPGEMISRHGVDGVYRVDRIMLMDISGAAVKLDERPAVLTASYCAGDFGH
jgi:hypothetical protein